MVGKDCSHHSLPVRSPAFPVQILPLQCLSEGKSEDPRALCPSHALRQQPVPRPQVQALQSRLGSCWEFGGAGGCQGRELGRAVRGGQQGPGVMPSGSFPALLQPSTLALDTWLVRAGLNCFQGKGMACKFPEASRMLKTFKYICMYVYSHMHIYIYIYRHRDIQSYPH